MSWSVVQDKTTDDRFDIIDQTSVPVGLPPLYRLPNQFGPLRFGALINESRVVRALREPHGNLSPLPAAAAW